MSKLAFPSRGARVFHPVAVLRGGTGILPQFSDCVPTVGTRATSILSSTRSFAGWLAVWTNHRKLCSIYRDRLLNNTEEHMLFVPLLRVRAPVFPTLFCQLLFRARHHQHQQLCLRAVRSNLQNDIPLNVLVFHRQ